MTPSPGRLPLVLLPGPDTPAADVTRLVHALPAPLRPVVLGQCGADVRPGPAPLDILLAQLHEAGVSGPFALHGWGNGAHLGLALAGRLERTAGYAVCTTLFVSDATAPGRTAKARAYGLTNAVRRTVTESPLVVCTSTVSGRPASDVAAWSRHSTSGTEFVDLPQGNRASNLSCLITTRLLPRAARLPTGGVWPPGQLPDPPPPPAAGSRTN
ncbi:hypothetical protein [Streptomyces bauhiniae]